MTPVDDFDLGVTIGEIQRSIEEINERDKTRPCIVHGEELARLKVKSGWVAAIVGAIMSLPGIILVLFKSRS